MSKFLFITSLCILGFQPWAISQNDSTGGQNKPKRYIETTYLLEDSVLLKPQQFSKIDTTLNGLHHTSPMFRSATPYQPINHLLSAALPLSFTPFQDPGLQMGYAFVEPYYLQRKNIRFYNTYTPYTQLRYFQGGTDEGLLALDVDHSQNIGEHVNFAVTHKSRKTDGLYENEGGSGTRLGFSLRVQSPNQRYLLLFSSIWNNFTLNANGGLSNPAAFPNYLSNTERLTASTSLNTAGITTFRNLQLSARQFYYFGKMDSVLLPDSSKVGRIVPRTYFSHKVSYIKRSHKYGSDTAAFYPLSSYSYSDILEVERWQEVRNELGWGVYLNRKDELYNSKPRTQRRYSEEAFYAAIDIRNIWTDQWNLRSLTENPSDSLLTESRYFNIHAKGRLRKSITPYTHFSGDLQYVLVGSNFSDYRYDLKLTQLLFKGMEIVPELKGQAHEPQWFFQEQQGILGNWQLPNWKKQFNNELGASLWFKKQYQLSVAAVRADNYVYLNEQLQPAQADSGINFLRLSLKLPIHLGKFHFLHDVQWQQLNSASVVTMPEWVVRLQYYYATEMFEGALRLRIGIDGQFFSAFEAFGFMPGFNQFHAQSGTITGGYPVLDVYVSARIKRWNGFAKFEHVNQGLLGYNYIMIPGYPQYPRVLRWGVAWRFYN